jgi:hypothetical protein
MTGVVGEVGTPVECGSGVGGVRASPPGCWAALFREGRELLAEAFFVFFVSFASLACRFFFSFIAALFSSCFFCFIFTSIRE